MAEKPYRDDYGSSAMAFKDGTALVLAAMKHLGTEGKDTEFSNKLGLGSHGPGRVGKWRKGISQPNFDAIMLILNKCGWLTLDEEAPRDEPLAETGLPPDLERLAEAVDEGFARLEAGIARVENRLDAQDGQEQS